MEPSNQGRILANLDLPAGKQLYNHNGETVLIYQAPDPVTKEVGWRMISRQMFSNMVGQPGCPPLVRLVERGKSGTKNIAFCHLWVDQTSGLINWRIGELSAGKCFEHISWKQYSQEAGIKNKGLGSQGSAYEQGLFEGSRKWVEFLEKKKYKLLFPGDEVVGNQLYFYRATEPEMLTSNFQIPEAMLAEAFEARYLPIGPVIIQPKYDGKRNLCGWQNGQVINASRGRKQAKGQHNHLKEQAAVFFFVLQEKLGLFQDVQTEQGVQRQVAENCPYWIDGEMFSFGMSFQALMSATQSSVNSNVTSRNISYIVYDLIDDGTTPQLLRSQFLQMIFNDPRVQALENIKLSPWYLVPDHSLIPEYHKQFELAGYEGAIVRDPAAFYVQKRTRAMMKMKSWQREEWYIVGAEVATGFHEGCIIYIMNSKPDGSGLTCRGNPIGSDIGNLESRRAQWQNKHLFVKQPPVVATIEFFEKSTEGIPRFPGVIALNRTDFIQPQ